MNSWWHSEGGANKPANYGVKLEMMCDSGIRYIVDCMPYLGKGTSSGSALVGEYFVKQTRSKQGMNRNNTIENWLASIYLTKQ